MQYNPTLFCQYLSCRLLPSRSADPVQSEGEERLLLELGGGGCSAAQGAEKALVLQRRARGGEK